MTRRKKRSRAIVTTRTEARRVRGRARKEAAFPAAPPRSELPRDYAETLGEIKGRIREERLRVVMAANAAMVLLYRDSLPTVKEIEAELSGKLRRRSRKRGRKS